ncbi:hypothetical protein BJ508DRAFT_315202 [Ascobolus immersus RN42]|uniref:Uncharacterized protein n=1 Tax=Ascobolus immersus RN42 TaxID=1160509 RepID=A0A3N4HQG5_ASCIM|nr:hypothetical protein BJ508DRAFT_315202 [Ascobolus immersus RN42]
MAKKSATKVAGGGDGVPSGEGVIPSRSTRAATKKAAGHVAAPAEPPVQAPAKQAPKPKGTGKKNSKPKPEEPARAGAPKAPMHPAPLSSQTITVETLPSRPRPSTATKKSDTPVNNVPASVLSGVSAQDIEKMRQLVAIFDTSTSAQHATDDSAAAGHDRKPADSIPTAPLSGRTSNDTPGTKPITKSQGKRKELHPEPGQQVKQGTSVNVFTDTTDVPAAGNDGASPIRKKRKTPAANPAASEAPTRTSAPLGAKPGNDLNRVPVDQQAYAGMEHLLSSQSTQQRRLSHYGMRGESICGTDEELCPANGKSANPAFSSTNNATVITPTPLKSALKNPKSHFEIDLTKSPDVGYAQNDSTVLPTPSRPNKPRTSAAQPTEKTPATSTARKARTLVTPDRERETSVHSVVSSDSEESSVRDDEEVQEENDENDESYEDEPESAEGEGESDEGENFDEEEMPGPAAGDDQEDLDDDDDAGSGGVSEDGHTAGEPAATEPEAAVPEADAGDLDGGRKSVVPYMFDKEAQDRLGAIRDATHGLRSGLFGAPMRKTILPFKPSCFQVDEDHNGIAPVFYSSNDNDMFCCREKPDFLNSPKKAILVNLRMFESFSKGWGVVAVPAVEGKENNIIGYVHDPKIVLRELLGTTHIVQANLLWDDVWDFGTTVVAMGRVRWIAQSCPRRDGINVTTLRPDTTTRSPTDQRPGGERFTGTVIGQDVEKKNKAKGPRR